MGSGNEIERGIQIGHFVALLVRRRRGPRWILMRGQRQPSQARAQRLGHLRAVLMMLLEIVGHRRVDDCRHASVQPGTVDSNVRMRLIGDSGTKLRHRFPLKWQLAACELIMAQHQRLARLQTRCSSRTIAGRTNAACAPVRGRSGAWLISAWPARPSALERTRRLPTLAAGHAQIARETRRIARNRAFSSLFSYF